MNDEFEVVKLVGCIVCGEPVIYIGPKILEFSKRYCSDICDAIEQARTPGIWLDASELAPGGSLHNRPELWSED